MAALVTRHVIPHLVIVSTDSNSMLTFALLSIGLLNVACPTGLSEDFDNKGTLIKICQFVNTTLVVGW